MAKMTDDELKAVVDERMRACVGYWQGELHEQYVRARQYYFGEAAGELAPPEVEGRSTVVSTDVRDTIEAMLPQLMVKFTGGDTVVEFEPQQRDDEARAKLCTEYLNLLFFKSDGHSVTYSWFKDALLHGNGIVKAWWDTRVEQTREEYKALSPIELAQLLEDPEIEPKEHSEYPDEEDAKQRSQALEQLTQRLQQAMQQPAAPGGAQAAPAPAGMAPAAQPASAPPVNPAVQQLQQQIAQIQAQPTAMLHDVTVERRKTGGKIRVEGVPSEEFLISREATRIEDAACVGHRVQRTLSQLKSMGYERVDRLAAGDELGRAESLKAQDAAEDDGSGDKSQRRVWVSEIYLRVDCDGDGIAELRKIVHAGGEILDNEVVDVAPFVCVTPIPVPHEFFGLSITDLARQVQRSKTGILRAMLDNVYLQVNGRYFAVEGQVNLDDLLTSRPGGVVRIKQPGMAGRLDQGVGDLASSMKMLEQHERMLETSTGWTRYSQGNDAGALQGTATGMNIVTNKDDMRLDLIARNMAEGFTALFRLMLKLVCQHQDKRVEARIAGQWVDMDPREWRNGFDVQINVGLGVGNKDQKIQHMMALLQHQASVFPLGVANPKTVYEGSVELAKLQGFKSGDKFFVDPQQHPPPPKPDPEAAKTQGAIQVEQLRQQGAQAIKQMELQAQERHEAMKAQATMQVERDKMQMQAQVDQHRQQVEAGQQQMKAQAMAEFEQFKAQLAVQAEQQKAEINAQLERERIAAENARAQLDAQTRLQIAQMGHQASLQAAAMQPAAANDSAVAPVAAANDGGTAETIAALQAEVAALKAPRPAAPIKFIRDDSGRATGFDVGGVVRKINRGEDGRMIHID